MGRHASVNGLQRGEVSRRTGCHLETIRYYENIGLMLEPRRSAKGYRLYDDTDVRRLRFILRSRELGFSIDEIRGLLDLVDRKCQTCAEIQERTKPHLTEIRAKIADLRRIERLLARTMAQCSGKNVPECPILDALKEDRVSTTPAEQGG